jgi:hypothetical protein
LIGHPDAHFGSLPDVTGDLPGMMIGTDSNERPSWIGKQSERKLRAFFVRTLRCWNWHGGRHDLRVRLGTEIAPDWHMSSYIHCQEAAFARARCRIELTPETDGLSPGRWLATASVIDRERHEVHPLVFQDGARVSFPAGSEALALNSILTYLESKFGGFSEIVYRCLPDTESAMVAAPIVIEPEPAETAGKDRAISGSAEPAGPD